MSRGDEVITIAGVGSLLSEASARESFDFTNFRVGQVRGWQRCFCQANWINVVCGASCTETNEVAALAMVPAAEDFVSHVALMDVVPEELPGFYEREAGYRILSVPYTVQGAETSATESGFALMCVACDDDEEADRLWSPDGPMMTHCVDKDYVVRWMRLSLRPLWPSQEPMSLQPVDPPLESAESVEDSLSTMDEAELPRGLVAGRGLYPAPGYLRDCAAAHDAAGLLEHFLDTTLLADRRSSLRSYLSVNSGLASYCMSWGPRPSPTSLAEASHTASFERFLWHRFS